jgi:O-antigen/teichoic acid export membrane protein
MFGLYAISESLVATLLGDQWLPSIQYIQLLSIVGLFYPLHAINLNMLNVLGRSDLFLKLEIVKKILAVPIIILGILYGVKVLIYGMIVNSIIAFFINSYWSGKYIGYSSLQQLKDIFPSFVFGLTVGAIVFYIGFLLKLPAYLTLIVKVFVGAGVCFLLAELTKMTDYIYIKEFVIEKLKTLKNGKKI